jgi:demethylsterigmatocystin 6-O-methyltransferase
VDRYHLPLHDAFHWEGDSFSFLKADPERQTLFNRHMQLQRDSITNWHIMSNLLESKQSPEGVLLVDVGGGVGHQCERIRTHCPNIKGRLVLQDLPEALKDALSIPGVEAVPHNVFEPQPIKGAFTPLLITPFFLFVFIFFFSFQESFTNKSRREVLLHAWSAPRFF